ncbi:MAG TPA: NADP-dependent oxidoreductase [Polyangiaceae bacterium]|jgi:NADPH:quinone reductase-like Zn-dependent oxidoreductase|nr:NADP-dependent oxidoreductase [Polyangiaceae bacterium]
MKAIVLTEYGGTDKLVLRDQPEPEPGAGQVKVRVASASINPVDWKLRSGHAKALMQLEFPAILGRDAAGEVVKVGAGVSEFKAGDRVMGLVMGAYAEFVVAPVAAWAKLADGLDAKDAGALPLALLTGDQLVTATLGGAGAGAGLTVLVTGAVGAVGRVACWGAKQRGAKVIAGVRSKQVEEAKALGVDGVVALDDEAALAALSPVDRIADTVGGDTVAKLLPKLKSGGVIGSVLGEPAAAKSQSVTVHAFQAHPDSKRLAELGAAVASGTLVIPIAKRFPLADAPAAQALAERGGVAKVLLMP